MIAEILLKIRHFYFSLRGIHFHPESVISGVPIRSFRLVGKYSNIYLGKNAEIRSGCYLIARDKIIIGENSTLAYGTTILTTADPNGPYNALAVLYPYKKAPVVIGDNVWIGANAVIVGKINIGNNVLIAPLSYVNFDIPSNSIVIGNPAKIIPRENATEGYIENAIKI